MRSRAALTLTAAVGLSFTLAAGAGARPHPEAYGATLQYIRAAKWLEPFAVTMRVVGGHSYRLNVANVRVTDNYRYFAWMLPEGMTLQRIVGSREGDCGISSGMISCTRKLAAGDCACSQADLVVDFTAVGRAPIRARGGYWIHYGLVTPYLDVPSTFNDVPVCDLGQKSTSAHPCLE